jgi:hypothetical protein
MLEAQDKKGPGYSRFLVPGNGHGRDAHVTLEVVKQLLNGTHPSRVTPPLSHVTFQRLDRAILTNF